MPAQASEIGPTLRQRVDFELKASTPDDELVAVADAADVNIIADATDLPTQSTLVETPWPGKQPWALWNLVKEITSRRMMAWYPMADDKTFLFWNQPDLAALRKALQEKDVVTTIAPQRDDLTIRRELISLLRDQYGWDGITPNFAVSIPFSRLPINLSRDMVAATQQPQATTQPRGFLQTAISDDFWQKARLKLIMPGRKTNATTQFPQLVLSYQQGPSSIDRVLVELKPQP